MAIQEKLILIIFALAIGTCSYFLTTPTKAMETAAEFAVILDYDTGTVLLEKNSAQPTAPASMSKLMTLYMVFEELKAGSLSVTDTFPVSEKAWRMGGSKMFVGVNTRISVSDLLRGIVVQSGNDACIVIAEGLAQSEAAFAEEMTERAREIGLQNSNFINATGWPHPDHVMSVADIAKLSWLIIKNFPEQYKLFSEINYTYNNIKQSNRNPLLNRYDGADGLKTGHTEASGYGLAASVERRNRRLILVVNGLSTQAQRAQETERLLDWAFREYNNYTLFEAGQTVDTAKVWLGDRSEISMIITNGLTLTLPRKVRRRMVVKLNYISPIPAPVRYGDKAAILTVSAPGEVLREIPLVAGQNVARLGVLGRLNAAFKYLAWGALE